MIKPFETKDASTVKHLACPMELKTLEKDGAFEGYASIFDNVDLGYDVVLKGAFKKKNMMLTKDGQIRVLHQHRTSEPIGKAKVGEDDKGLHFQGQLILSVPEAQKAHELMKEGVLDGMSIGYDVLKDEYTEGGVRRLHDLKLWEISVVTFGMNPKAKIDDVKSVTNVRDLEDLLRDATGLSRAQAKLHAGAIWKTLSGQREADGEGAEVAQRMVEFLNSIG